MPKVTLEYQLPEEISEYEATMNAGKMHSVLWSMSVDVFRKAAKYHTSDNEVLQGLLNNTETHEATMQVIEALREEFYKLLKEHGVEL